MICEVCRSVHDDPGHPHRVACERVTRLRIEHDRWPKHIAEAPDSHLGRRDAIERDLVARRDHAWVTMEDKARAQAIEQALAAADAEFAAGLADMQRQQGETARALAAAEQEILDLRAAPGRERRAAARGEIAALVERHGAATAKVEAAARGLVAAIDDVHSIERQLAQFHAHNGLSAGGLRLRLQSIAWPMRDWFPVVAGHDPRVNVPFVQRCRKLLADLEFVPSDRNGRAA